MTMLLNFKTTDAFLIVKYGKNKFFTNSDI